MWYLLVLVMSIHYSGCSKSNGQKIETYATFIPESRVLFKMICELLLNLAISFLRFFAFTFKMVTSSGAIWSGPHVYLQKLLK